jgi:hypothetical protein
MSPKNHSFNIVFCYYGLSAGAWKHWSKVWDLDYNWIKNRFDQGSYEKSKVSYPMFGFVSWAHVPKKS